MTDTNKPRFINAKRRGFLQGAAVAGGAVATGTVVAAEVVAGEDESVSVEPSGPTNKGYEKNDYVKRYYERARF